MIRKIFAFLVWSLMIGTFLLGIELPFLTALKWTIVSFSYITLLLIGIELVPTSFINAISERNSEKEKYMAQSDEKFTSLEEKIAFYRGWDKCYNWMKSKYKES